MARHHVFVKMPPKQIQLAEVGPRFDMKPYEIRQGTIEQKEADREWVLAHYSRTAKKRSHLSTGARTKPTEPENNDVEKPPRKRKR